MFKKQLPYIFLLLLILLLIFIGGVKYGQKVEQTNKVIRYVLSITPTIQPPTAAPTQKIEYKTYISDCGINFLYPTYLTPIVYQGVGETVNFVEESELKNSSADLILECKGESATGFTEFMADSEVVKNATPSSVLINNNKGLLYKNTGKYLLKVENKKVKRYIGITVSKELYPLIESSLELTTPTPIPTKRPSPTSIITP